MASSSSTLLDPCAKASPLPDLPDSTTTAGSKFGGDRGDGSMVINAGGAFPKLGSRHHSNGGVLTNTDVGVKGDTDEIGEDSKCIVIAEECKFASREEGREVDKALRRESSSLVSSTISGFPQISAEDLRTEEANDMVLIKKEEDVSALLAAPSISSSFVQIAPNSEQEQQMVLVHPNQPVQVFQQPASDIFTLTLNDGSIVHLKLQRQQQPDDDEASSLGVLAQPPQELRVSIHPPSLCSSYDRASPPSVAEEIVVPFLAPTDSTTASPSLPSAYDGLPLLSPTEATVFKTAAEACEDHKGGPLQPGPSTSSRSNSLSSSSSSFNDASSEYSSESADDPLFSLIASTSMNSMTIESLKSQLTHLPEGQSADLSALLTAAHIDLTVDDIVRPPLTQVKRVMEAKMLAEWQVQLCIKIRRRKKNTVREKPLSDFFQFFAPRLYHHHL